MELFKNKEINLLLRKLAQPLPLMLYHFDKREKIKLDFLTTGKIVNLYLKLLLTLIIIGCSFEPPEKRSMNALEASPFSVDSDGDGVNDNQELRDGTDPLIADIPKVNGKYFNELNIDIDFYNKSLNKFETIKWSFSDNKLKLGWEEVEYDAIQGPLYMESLLKSGAFASNFKRTDQRFYDYNESIFSFSSPNINEPGLINISKKTLQLIRNNYFPYSLGVIIQSQFEVKSEKFKSFRKPQFDIYYKSNKQEALIYLDTKELDGTYTFNENHEIYIDYQSRSPEVIYDSVINGGAKLFIKLKDFTIYENGEKYSEIIKSVQSKSVPLTISYMEDDGKSPARIETMYIGINGETSNLEKILKIAFKDEIQISEGNIDRISGFYNRERSIGKLGENELLKWFIGAEFVNEHIFDHEFRPSEGIGLAYFSNKKTENTPLYLTRAQLAGEKVASSGKLPIKSRNYKIRISPKKIRVPTETKKKVKKSHCGKGLWKINQVHYLQTILEWTDRASDYYENQLNEIYFKIYTIKGTILDGNLGTLVKRKFLSSKRLDSGEIELELLEPLKKEFTNNDLQILIDLKLTPTPLFIRNGELEVISKKCVRQESRDPPRAADGAIHGGMLWGENENSFENYSEGMGFMEESVQADYDLDIHFISY